MKPTSNPAPGNRCPPTLARRPLAYSARSDSRSNTVPVYCRRVAAGTPFAAHLAARRTCVCTSREARARLAPDCIAAIKNLPSAVRNHPRGDPCSPARLPQPSSLLRFAIPRASFAWPSARSELPRLSQFQPRQRPQRIGSAHTISHPAGKAVSACTWRLLALWCCVWDARVEHLEETFIGSWTLDVCHVLPAAEANCGDGDGICDGGGVHGGLRLPGPATPTVGYRWCSSPAVWRETVSISEANTSAAPDGSPRPRR